MQEEIYNDIVEALQLVKVHLYFLPAYSPELDAAEFVFHEIKREVKKHRNGETLSRHNGGLCRDLP